MRWLTAVMLTGLLVGACAPQVAQRASQLTPAAGAADGIEILQDTQIWVGPGYQRVLARGSRWARVGRTPEGDVYKPIDGVFTVEGAHVHEAYLVLEGEQLMGFYLPVERTFSPAADPRPRLPLQRRQP